jgi:hypothetical protein
MEVDTSPVDFRNTTREKWKTSNEPMLAVHECHGFRLKVVDYLKGK